jgi:hypothetical protein
MLAILTARTEANAESFRRMCDRTGYDPARAGEHPLAFALAARRCVFCRRTEACRVYLETPGDEAPDFCPNAFFFETSAEN